MDNRDLWELSRVVFSYPAIDNHAHAFLREEHKTAYPFEGVISEATGEALKDAVHTLACFRAAAQLSKLFGIGPAADWEAVKKYRNEVPYEQLCKVCMNQAHIQCILIDDGLGVGGADTAKLYDYKWHDRYTTSPTKRIVRVEAIAERIFQREMDRQIESSNISPGELWDVFARELQERLRACAADPEVVGFKSIACYRTGLDISLGQSETEQKVTERTLMSLILLYASTGVWRLAEKPIVDHVVNLTMRIAGECGKPVQFHTGLGDNDITLKLSSPSHLQPLIKAYPDTKVVLLHASYPFTQEAGYLTSVYPNVYLDFGEVFPAVSSDGQREILRQVLELAPTNKIMWSTDGHFWPETYYLASVQSRQAFFEVLEGHVRKWEITLPQAIDIVKRAFFHNANRVYNLGLEPRPMVT